MVSIFGGKAEDYELIIKTLPNATIEELIENYIATKEISPPPQVVVPVSGNKINIEAPL